MDQELIEMRDEEADSDDGPISDVALKIADEVLAYRPELRPAIAPDSAGGICMEWAKGQAIMRVVIRANGLNSYIYTRRNSPPDQGSAIHPLQRAKCESCLDWFVANEK